MSARRDHDKPAVVAWSLSLAVHLALSMAGVKLVEETFAVDPTPSTATTGASGGEIQVDLLLPPAAPDGALESHPGRARSEPTGGGERTPRPDSGRAGHAGDALVSAPAVNLAPADDEAHLSPALRSRLERAQETRRRSGRGRSSPEDDTVSERPMILTFYADGAGLRPEQRPAAATDPAGGAWDRFRAQAPGPPARPQPRGDEWLTHAWYEGGSGEARAPGAGVMDRAAGRDSRPSAAVGEGRPMAVRGRDSTRSVDRGPESDSVDAEQEVMARSPSLLNASTAGGDEQGPGRGGEPADGPTGSGGLEGPGSRSQALGDGRGAGVGVDPADARRRSYFRRMWQRIQQSWSPAAFPKWAAMQGLAGTTIVSFVVGPDGSVGQVLTVRPSGYPSFDAAMRAAVMKAAPFGPLPPELGPVLRHSHEFAVTNPAVR